MIQIVMGVSSIGGKTIIDMGWLGTTELRNDEADLLLEMLQKCKEIRELRDEDGVPTKKEAVNCCCLYYFLVVVFVAVL